MQLDGELVGFFQNDFQKRRRSDVTVRLQIGHRLNLLLRLSDAAREYRAAQCMRAGFDHRSRGREVIGKAVVNEISAPKSGSVQRAGEPPIIGRAPFRLVDRTGRTKSAPRVAPSRCGKSAEGT